MTLRLATDGPDVVLTDQVSGQRWTLPVSGAVLASRFVRHDIPTEAEVEYAINTIEDTLMALPRFEGRTLHSDDTVLTALLSPVEAPQPEWSAEALEALFTRFALRSMGRPAAYDDVDARPEPYMSLLVVREMMHHLGLAGVRLGA